MVVTSQLLTKRAGRTGLVRIAIRLGSLPARSEWRTALGLRELKSNLGQRVLAA